MPRSLPYVWLFLALWLTMASAMWFPSDWNAYYDRGHGPEVKFHLAFREQIIICAIVGLIGAAFTTVLARWTHLWLVSKPVKMG